MKKLFTLLMVYMFAIGAFAQAPEKMSYQAVIRNSGGELVKSSNVGMQISILTGSVTGTAVYVETQIPTTNANGLVTIEIGNGTPVTGTFAGIDWSTGTYFIKTEIDPTGGTDYSITGTSQLLSVPYALMSSFAKNVETIPNNSVNSAKIQDGSIANADLASMGATAGQVLSFSGTAWAPTTLAPNPWIPSGTKIYYNSGYVGIGTSIPKSPLHVKTSLSEIARFESSATSKWIALYHEDARKGLLWSAENEIKLRSDEGGLAFQTGGVNTDRITITSDGKTGIGDATPDATLDVEGTVVIGSEGRVFFEIREIIGTTELTGSYTSVSYPTGYTKYNTRILSAEINYNGTNWNTLGMFTISSEYSVGCSLSNSSISICYPDLPPYYNKAFRILLMKVQ